MICNYINVIVSSARFISITYPLRYHALVTQVRVWIALGALLAWNFIETTLLFGFGHQLTSHMTCKYFVFLSVIYRMYYIPQLVLFLSLTIILYAAIARTAIQQVTGHIIILKISQLKGYIIYYYKVNIFRMLFKSPRHL